MIVRLLAFGMATVLLTAGCGGKQEALSSDGGSRTAPDLAATWESGDTVHSLADELGDQLEKFANALAKAKEEATVEQAHRAKQTLAEVGAEIQSIARRLENLEVPPDGVKLEIAKRMAEQERAIEQKLGNRTEFLESLASEIEAIVREAMRSFRSDMDEAGAVFDKYFDTHP